MNLDFYNSIFISLDVIFYLIVNLHALFKFIAYDHNYESFWNSFNMFNSLINNKTLIVIIISTYSVTFLPFE